MSLLSSSSESDGIKAGSESAIVASDDSSMLFFTLLVEAAGGADDVGAALTGGSGGNAGAEAMLGSLVGGSDALTGGPDDEAGRRHGFSRAYCGNCPGSIVQ